ncbi:MAG: hypothetical protein J3K34DRAFT_424208 [Monoraphidium minutum]|nr:MAG: hypothetical protein J3K34DRAFT_424208 [Monoraphidium minutum]
MSYEEMVALEDVRVGTPAAALAALPRRPAAGGGAAATAGEAEAGEAAAGDEAERCVICLCDYEPGDPQLLLPCGHALHDGCGSQWLARSKKCPICKREVC